MTLEIEQFMCRSDNFGVLARNPESGEAFLVDAPQEAPILEAIERTGWRPSVLLVTHHHGDHVEANLALKQRYGLKIVGPKAEASKIPGIDVAVSEGESLQVAGHRVEVLDTPGHTAGHVCFVVPEAGVAFTGDTLFSVGCGRLIEKGAPEMLASLRKLAALPPGMRVYCGHEYTLANARFALTVDPGNAALQERAREVERLQEEGNPALPTTIGQELATNPFLRWDDPAIRSELGMEDASDEAVFAEIRGRKDLF